MTEEIKRLKTELEIANERIIELELQVKKLSSNLPVMRPLPTIQEVWDRFPEGNQVHYRVGANWVRSVMSA